MTQTVSIRVVFPESFGISAGERLVQVPRSATLAAVRSALKSQPEGSFPVVEFGFEFGKKRFADSAFLGELMLRAMQPDGSLKIEAWAKPPASEDASASTRASLEAKETKTVVRIVDRVSGVEATLRVKADTEWSKVLETFKKVALQQAPNSASTLRQIDSIRVSGRVIKFGGPHFSGAVVGLSSSTVVAEIVNQHQPVRPTADPNPASDSENLEPILKRVRKQSTQFEVKQPTRSSEVFSGVPREAPTDTARKVEQPEAFSLISPVLRPSEPQVRGDARVSLGGQSVRTDAGENSETGGVRVEVAYVPKIEKFRVSANCKVKKMLKRVLDRLVPRSGSNSEEFELVWVGLDEKMRVLTPDELVGGLQREGNETAVQLVLRKKGESIGVTTRVSEEQQQKQRQPPKGSPTFSTPGGYAAFARLQSQNAPSPMDLGGLDDFEDLEDAQVRELSLAESRKVSRVAPTYSNANGDYLDDEEALQLAIALSLSEN